MIYYPNICYSTNGIKGILNESDMYNRSIMHSKYMLHNLKSVVLNLWKPHVF